MKIYADPAVDRHLDEAVAKYGNDREKILGICLTQPCEPLNSSSRKVMYAIQSTHRVNLVKPEIPLLATAYENHFGQKSASYITADSDQTVLFKIDKFSNSPNHHYFLITLNDKNEMDLIEVKSYNHSTEMYGYMYNNDYLNRLSPGDNIRKDDTIRSSAAFDEYGNHMPGANLNCAYMALSKNTEDPVLVSKSASIKMSTVSIKKVELNINDNEIPINLYGDKNTYKLFPDIGEDINSTGALIGIRQENKDESFFTQDIERLSSPMISDEVYKPMEGKVIDINVYCNRQITDDDDVFNCYCGQLRYYIDENKRFCREFTECMKNYIDNSNYKKSYELSMLYTRCQMILNGAQFISDKNIFSNIFVEIYVYSEIPLRVGDKISNRFGGKGVVSEIRDDDMMPLMVGSNKPADLIWNQATCPNRLNLGQLVESSLNNISRSIINYIDTRVLHADECFEMLLDFLKIISPEYEAALKEYVDSNIEDDSMMLEMLGTFLTENSDGFQLALKPISECVSFDTLREIYEKFPFIGTRTCFVPIRGSNGQIRFVESNKPSIIGQQYIYRLKQYAEEKHSATSLSSTNVRSENAKSRDSKLYLRARPSTPIKMGEMETSIEQNLGAEIVATNLMLNSSSPQGRRAAITLLQNDPYNVDIHLPENAKSRSVEKVNATMKTMGLVLRFEKIRKNKRPMMQKVSNVSPMIQRVDVLTPAIQRVAAVKPMIQRVGIIPVMPMMQKVSSVKPMFEKIS